ncbi:MAG: hypothetical protein IKW77_01795 [Salinivirgaceae bacterium]|nr:hypothetical protein [Salinivirgaceae bacterium]
MRLKVLEYVEGQQERVIITITKNSAKAEIFTDTDNKWQMAHSVVENPNTKAFEVEKQPNGGFVAVFE